VGAGGKKKKIIIQRNLIIRRWGGLIRDRSREGVNGQLTMEKHASHSSQPGKQGMARQGVCDSARGFGSQGDPNWGVGIYTLTRI